MSTFHANSEEAQGYKLISLENMFKAGNGLHLDDDVANLANLARSGGGRQVR